MSGDLNTLMFPNIEWFTYGDSETNDTHSSQLHPVFFHHIKNIIKYHDPVDNDYEGGATLHTNGII